MAEQRNPPELDARPQSRREWSGWLRSLVLPLGLVMAIVGGLLYFESRGPGAEDDGAYGTVELPTPKNATAKTPAAEAGRAAPDFLLQDLDGNDVRLSDLQGRPVLVNFWATWCVSCRVEMPDLVRTYATHEKDGLLILGVNLREATQQVQPFVANFGMRFPVLLDRSGAVAQTWRIGGPNQGVPSTYFIDTRGVVQRVVFGTLTAKSLSEGLALILTPGQ